MSGSADAPARRPSLLGNTLSSWGSVVVTVAFNLVLTPFILAELGEARLGIWRLLLSVVGYYGVIDVALFAGIIRFTSRYAARRDASRLNETLSTAMALLLGLSLVIALSCWLLAEPLADFFEVGAQREEFVRVVLLLGATTALRLPGQLLATVPLAHERLGIVYGIRSLSEAALGSASIWILVRGGGLPDLAVAQLFRAAVVLVVFAGVARIAFPSVSISPRHWSRATASELLRFGSISFLTKVGDLLRFQIDLAVVGRLVGLTATGTYSIAAQVFRVLWTVVISGSNPLQPRLAGLAGTLERPAFAASFLAYSNAVAVLAAGVASVIFLCAEDFLRLWVPEADVAGAALILRILVLGVLPDLMSTLTVKGLMALNCHRPYAIQTLLEGVANVALSIALAQRYGAPGVALGTAISVGVTRFCIQPFYASRLLGLDRSAYVGQILLRPLLPLAILIGAVQLSGLVPSAESFPGLVAKSALFVLAFAGLAYPLSLMEEVRGWIRATLRTRLGAHRPQQGGS